MISHLWQTFYPNEWCNVPLLYFNSKRLYKCILSTLKTLFLSHPFLLQWCHWITQCIKYGYQSSKAINRELFDIYIPFLPLLLQCLCVKQEKNDLFPPTFHFHKVFSQKKPPIQQDSITSHTLLCCNLTCSENVH